MVMDPVLVPPLPRIDLDAVHLHAEMHVNAAGQAGLARDSDSLTLVDQSPTLTPISLSGHRSIAPRIRDPAQCNCRKCPNPAPTPRARYWRRTLARARHRKDRSPGAPADRLSGRGKHSRASRRSWPLPCPSAGTRPTQRIFSWVSRRRSASCWLLARRIVPLMKRKRASRSLPGARVPLESTECTSLFHQRVGQIEIRAHDELLRLDGDGHGGGGFRAGRIARVRPPAQRRR